MAVAATTPGGEQRLGRLVERKDAAPLVDGDDAVGRRVEHGGELGDAAVARLGIEPERLEKILAAFFRPDTTTPQQVWMKRFFPHRSARKDE